MRWRRRGSTPEDAAYGAVFGFLRQNGFLIAIVGPLVIAWLSRADPWALIVVVIWLIEAAAYAVWRLLHGARIRDAPEAIVAFGVRLGWRFLFLGAVCAIVAIDQLRALIAGW